MNKTDSYYVDKIVVRSYFHKGGMIVGTEECSSESEAVNYARHQANYFPYIEIVRIHGVEFFWGFEEKSCSVLSVFSK